MYKRTYTHTHTNTHTHKPANGKQAKTGLTLSNVAAGSA